MRLSRIRFFQDTLLSWYKCHRRSFSWRKTTASNYVKVLAEILLQQTRAQAVSQILADFASKFPTWETIADSHDLELFQSVARLGLGSQRVKRLKQVACAYIGFGFRFPSSLPKLTAVNGIGPYLANGILLFYHRKAVPLLDGNMARIISRFERMPTPKDVRCNSQLISTSKELVHTNHAIALNWAIMDFAATVCKHTPRCHACPLSLKCRYVASR